MFHPMQHAFQLQNTQLNATKTHKQATNEGSCSKGQAEHSREETQHLVISMGSRLQAVIDL